MPWVGMSFAIGARTGLAMRAGDAAEDAMANHQALPAAPFARQPDLDIDLAVAGRIAGRAE